MEALLDLFTRLRNQPHLTDESIATFTQHIVKLARDQNSFVLGAIIYHRVRGGEGNLALIDHGSLGTTPHTPDPLFFGEEFDNDTKFKNAALETLKTLKSKDLFLSSVIHEHLPARARRIELWYSGNESIRDSSDKAIAHNPLNQFPQLIHRDLTASGLQDSIEQIVEKAREYVEVIQGYFPQSSTPSPSGSNHILAYCPFLVSDGNPPGNFFGVFRRPVTLQPEQSTGDDDLARFLTHVQMVGTLIFAQVAMRNLLSLENHKKFRLIRDKVNKLEELRRSMEQTIEELEREVDQFRFSTGATAIRNWSKALPNFFMNDNHDATKWTQGHVDALLDNAVTEASLESLKVELGEKCFREFFGHVIDGKLEYCPYIAKAINSQMVPLIWLINDAVPAAALVLGNNTRTGELLVPPVSYAIAFRSLKTIPGTTAKVQLPVNGETTCTIAIKVASDARGAQGLTMLQQSVNTKLALIQSSRFSGNLSSGHTSNCIAVVLSAATKDTTPSWQHDQVDSSVSVECTCKYRVLL